MSTDTRAERAANLFDLRRIIGSVFVAWGVLLIILGATDSAAEANKAAGININLFAGIGMFVFGVIFWAWALTRPLGRELAEAESEQAGSPQRGAAGASEDASRGVRGDREGTSRPIDPRGQ